MVFKRSREQSSSNQTPFNKVQKINFMPEKKIFSESEKCSDDYLHDDSYGNFTESYNADSDAYNYSHRTYRTFRRN